VIRFEFHSIARSDVSRIMDYYEDAGGQELADEFYEELWSCINKAVDSPEGYAIRERDIRRVNLERFPFHFLYRIVDDRVRILVVRHHRRRPSLGMQRR
jgi:plasmid stabilization system protein ParE